jgi:hypothetical protein
MDAARGRKLYWQENATRKPPPPGAVPPPEVRVIIVPCAEFDAALADAVEPGDDEVVTLRRTLEAVHVVLLELGVTEYRFQVVVAPEYE